LIQILAAQQDIRDRCKWWIVHPAAVLQLFLIETAVVVCGGKLNGGMLGKVGLQDKPSEGVAASPAFRHLGNKPRGCFVGTTVWEAQSGIGPDNPDQRDPVNIVSFSDHLSAHKQIDFASMQAIKDTLEVIAPAHRVAIKATDPRVWKEAMQTLFKLF